ncbi:YraN family protein [uncultured Clostridium sp.]|uniref:YraN family protein n=1 Tax=uncultured Clostridium sp. TaxID=59620 RepID=UPI0028EFC65E|nr:YraN family protein [uncultured Clostridium sp.]
MNFYKKNIGNFGEDLAESYLIESGYIILEKNFRCKTGEIDLIGRDGNFISFIEVKTRCGNSYGSPGEAVNYVKQWKIYKTAQMYILKKKLHRFNFRFDVVEIILNHKSHDFSISVIKDAFQV